MYMHVQYSCVIRFRVLHRRGHAVPLSPRTFIIYCCYVWVLVIVSVRKTVCVYYRFFFCVQVVAKDLKGSYISPPLLHHPCLTASRPLLLLPFSLLLWSRSLNSVDVRIDACSCVEENVSKKLANLLVFVWYDLFQAHVELDFKSQHSRCYGFAIVTFPNRRSTELGLIW